MKVPVVSIKDVAARAGVSPGTVSNVFSGMRAVNPELAARVREAAAALGYQPDRAASQLRAGKARVVAVLVPDLINPFFAGLVAAIEARVRRDAYDIIVASSIGDAAEESSRLSTLLAWRPAGIVVIPRDDDFAGRALIERAGVPFVVADRVPSGFEGDAVTVDNVAAGAMAVQHLIDLGHEDIVVAASTMTLQNIRERCEGIERVTRAHGLQIRSLIEVGLEFEMAAERLGAFMAQDRRPSAFLALTNFGTLGILATLQQWGLKVPDDVSVVGFDDYSWMRAVTPPLTAVRQPVDELGHEIWSRLKARIDGGTAPYERVKLSCELIVRGSTTAPSAAWREGRAA